MQSVLVQPAIFSRYEQIISSRYGRRFANCSLAAMLPVRSLVLRLQHIKHFAASCLVSSQSVTLNDALMVPIEASKFRVESFPRAPFIHLPTTRLL